MRQAGIIAAGCTLPILYLTPLRQARETYVRVNLLRKYYFELFQNKIMLKKIKIL